MIPFKLNNFIANPSLKVITRNGMSVSIGRIDKRDSHPVKAIIDDKQFLAFDCDGHLFNSEDSVLDLFFDTEVKEKWINLYKDWEGYHIGSIIYESEEDAKDINELHPTYVATIKITWEEPSETITNE